MNINWEALANRMWGFMNAKPEIGASTDLDKLFPEFSISAENLGPSKFSPEKLYDENRGVIRKNQLEEISAITNPPRPNSPPVGIINQPMKYVEEASGFLKNPRRPPPGTIINQGEDEVGGFL